MVSISGSAHLQGRQWVDMSGWSEGSEDKGEVCVRCEGVGGVGWGPQGSGNPSSHAATQQMQRANATPTHTHVHTHMYTHTSSSSSSDLLAPKGVGQGPGSSLGPVTKADRLSNGWAGQAHARQPWGEWLLGTLAVKMAVRRARWTAR